MSLPPLINLSLFHIKGRKFCLLNYPLIKFLQLLPKNAKLKLKFMIFPSRVARLQRVKKKKGKKLVKNHPIYIESNQAQVSLECILRAEDRE